MDCFVYRDGVLHAESVPVTDIVAAAGTPFYVYSADMLVRQFRLLDEGLAGTDHLICFAVKSNSNLAVLKLLGEQGAGMDVVSGGEYARARAAGVPGERIVFSGVGKTRGEMYAALTGGGVRQFNVESEPEMEVLNEVALSLGVRAPIAVRVNPGVDAATHDKIATGRFGDKFGIPIGRAPRVHAAASTMKGLKVVGLDVHIGSQLTDLAPFEAAYAKIVALGHSLRADGHDIRRLDFGGGLGIPYEPAAATPPLAEYCALIRRCAGDLGCGIDIEPGRLISGNAGLMVARTIYVKRGEDRDFLILDAAMNDLIRPAMYGAHHEIIPAVELMPGTRSTRYDVVGPVCESGDTFARGRELPPMKPGDLVAFRSAGAYAAAMASEYNTRPLVPEVLVQGDKFAVIRARPALEEILNRDNIPEWL